MKERGIVEAEIEASFKKEKQEKSSLDFNINYDSQVVPEGLYKRFFEIQSDVEKSDSGMDYHEYSKRLWKEFVSEQGLEGEVYTQFEANLIRGMHDIGMEELMCDDVRENMLEIVKSLYGNAGTVIIWSKGDSEATGYQDAKIGSSNWQCYLIGH